MQPTVGQGGGKEELGLLALAACLNRERVKSPSAVLSLPQYTVGNTVCIWSYYMIRDPIP